MRPVSRTCALVLAGSLAALACREQPSADTARALRPAASPATDAGGHADAPAQARDSDGGVDGSGAPPAAGQWVETALYRFRLDELVSCASAPDGGADAHREVPWLGARVRIAATAMPLFVTPRDVTLRRGGLILDPQYLDQPALPRCAPLLPLKQLGADQEARGFVLFRLAPSLRAGRGPIAIAYHPTRWGGSRGVEVIVPECLGDCPVKDESRALTRTRKSRSR
jgi:hypothetical protein